MSARLWGLAALALLLIALVVGLRLYLPEEGQVAAVRAPRPQFGTEQLPPPGPVASAPAVPAADTPLPPPAESSVDAGVTMREAMEKGDPAAAPLQRTAAREEATAAELADPSAYQRYEARQNQRLYNQYLKAAGTEIPRLQDDITRARSEGLPPEQIAEGEEKLRRIQAMKEQLQTGQGAAAP